MMPQRVEKDKGTNIPLISNPQFAADCLAKEAEKLGNLNRYLSPFAREAQRVFGDFEPRGKPDDVTVIVTQVHSMD